MVYYYIPEDFDSADEPNAFGISKNIEEITMRDIRNAFPLPGKYHFRFKHVINKNTVWMDLNNDSCAALQFQNKILVKVTRIGWETSPSPAIPKAKINSPPPNVLNLFDFNPQVKKPESFDLLFHN